MLPARLLARVYDPLLQHVEARGLRAWRAELLASATGRVLEIGAGTGLNLLHYPPGLEQLVLAEPDPFMLRRLAFRLTDLAAPPVSLMASAAEALALPAASVDCVVSTLVLCTVAEPRICLGEIVRVLRPGGRLLFLEHVLDETRPGIAAWQRRLTPLWRRCSGDCHLDRRTAGLLAAAGLRIETLHRGAMPGAPALFGPVIRGCARKP